MAFWLNWCNQRHKSIGFGQSKQGGETVCVPADISSRTLRVVELDFARHHLLTVGNCSAGTLHCIGLRHTELPWYLYWVFWLAAIAVMLQIFVGGHDIMFTKEDSDEIVGKLQSPVNTALQALSLEERRKILKRSMAMTGLQFDIAGLGSLILGLPSGSLG